MVRSRLEHLPQASCTSSDNGAPCRERPHRLGASCIATEPAYTPKTPQDSWGGWVRVVHDASRPAGSLQCANATLRPVGRPAFLPISERLGPACAEVKLSRTARSGARPICSPNAVD